MDTQSVQAQGINSCFFCWEIRQDSSLASTVVVLLGGNKHPTTTEEVQLGRTGIVSKANVSLGG